MMIALSYRSRAKNPPRISRGPRSTLGLTSLLVLVLRLAGCSGPIEPTQQGLTGVWVGTASSTRLPLDSVHLVIVDSAGEVNGFGRMFPFNGLTHQDGGGTGDWDGVNLHLTLGDPFLAPFGWLALDLRLESDVLRGSTSDGTTAVFQRRIPAARGIQGRWVLSRTRGWPTSPRPEWVDTLQLLHDGRVSRRYMNSFCSGSSLATYRRTENRVTFEHMLFIPYPWNCGVEPYDTLIVTGSSLTRRIVLLGGGLAEEIYERR